MLKVGPPTRTPPLRSSRKNHSTHEFPISEEAVHRGDYYNPVHPGKRNAYNFFLLQLTRKMRRILSSDFGHIQPMPLDPRSSELCEFHRSWAEHRKYRLLPCGLASVSGLLFHWSLFTRFDSAGVNIWLVLQKHQTEKYFLHQWLRSSSLRYSTFVNFTVTFKTKLILKILFQFYSSFWD